MNKRPIIVIAGCTASGKSDVAIKLAKEINGVIINADSRQVYKEISIGTAKPTPDEIEDGVFIIDGIKHYLYSYISVKQQYNLYQYQKDVFTLLKKLPVNVTPILVGGTGLYIDSVVYNYKLKENPKKEINIDLKGLSIKDLQKMIGSKKLEKLNKSDKENPRRLMHIIKHGLPSVKKGKALNHLYFFLDIDVDTIKKNIRLRVEKMFEAGLINENELIHKERLNIYPALDTIGYREFDGYFNGEKSIQEVKEEIITHTNQYAKRQRTWFRRNENVEYVKSLEEILSTINTHFDRV